MPDEEVREIKAADRARAKRFSILGMILAGVAVLVFVGGTLLSVLSADDSTPEDERERPTLEALMSDADLVLRGSATQITRIGEPSDAGAVAAIDVETVVAPSGNDPGDVVVYDQGFRESWLQDQQMLLFLSIEGSLPGGAEFRVLDRCVLEDRALPCPFELEDIERLAEE